MKFNDYIADRRKRDKAFDEGYDEGLAVFMLGQALALAREDSGWSQKTLAEKSGVSVWSISRIEKKTENANIGEISAVAKSLQPWLGKYGYGENHPLFKQTLKAHNRIVRVQDVPAPRIVKPPVHAR